MSPVGDADRWKHPEAKPEGYVGGHFRANWQLGIDTIPTGMIEGTEYKGALEREQSKIPHLYINKIKHLAKKIFKNTISDNDIAFMILCSIKLSFADVKGANPFPNEEVTYNKEYEMKNKKGKFSFIANTGKIHSGSSISPFVKFKYDTEGMKIIKRILRKILPAKLT